MRMPSLYTLVAVLATAFITTAGAATAADRHLLPVAQSAVALKSSQTVGVLYSENTVGTLDYLSRYHAMAQQGAPGSTLDGRIRAAFINSSEPRLAVDWLQASLSKTFAKVTVYPDLDSLMKARPDVTVMLDTYSQLVTQRNTQVEARYIATFYDADLQYIGKAEGAGAQQMSAVWVRDKNAEQIAAAIDQQRQLQVNALQQFDGSLKALVGGQDGARVASN